MAQSIRLFRAGGLGVPKRNVTDSDCTLQSLASADRIEAQISGARLGRVPVMRRTHSRFLREFDVAPEIRAQQMGHTVDVNENVYTKTSLESRRQAVNRLEAALG